MSYDWNSYYGFWAKLVMGYQPVPHTVGPDAYSSMSKHWRVYACRFERKVFHAPHGDLSFAVIKA